MHTIWNRLRGSTSRARLCAIGLALTLGANEISAESGKIPNKKIAKGSGVTVFLQGDREIKGIYLGRHDGAVWIGLDGGEIGIEASTILKMTVSETAEGEFSKRKAALDPKAADGWWELSKWAQERELTSSARSAAETLLTLDPEHAEARAYLGYEKIKGVWVDFAEGQRLRGNVLFEGEWMNHEQAESIEIMRGQSAMDKSLPDRLRAAALARARAHAPPEREDLSIHGHTEPLARSPDPGPTNPSRVIKRVDVPILYPTQQQH